MTEFFPIETPPSSSSTSKDSMDESVLTLSSTLSNKCRSDEVKTEEVETTWKWRKGRRNQIEMSIFTDDSSQSKRWKWSFLDNRRKKVSTTLIFLLVFSFKWHLSKKKSQSFVFVEPIEIFFLIVRHIRLMTRNEWFVVIVVLDDDVWDECKTQEKKVRRISSFSSGEKKENDEEKEEKKREQKKKVMFFSVKH